MTMTTVSFRERSPATTSKFASIIRNLVIFFFCCSGIRTRLSDDLKISFLLPRNFINFSKKRTETQKSRVIHDEMLALRAASRDKRPKIHWHGEHFVSKSLKLSLVSMRCHFCSVWQMCMARQRAKAFSFHFSSFFPSSLEFVEPSCCHVLFSRYVVSTSTSTLEKRV